jgi:hypothetical protein
MYDSGEEGAKNRYEAMVTFGVANKSSHQGQQEESEKATAHRISLSQQSGRGFC